MTKGKPRFLGKGNRGFLNPFAQKVMLMHTHDHTHPQGAGSNAEDMQACESAPACSDASRLVTREAKPPNPHKTHTNPRISFFHVLTGIRPRSRKRSNPFGSSAGRNSLVIQPHESVPRVRRMHGLRTAQNPVWRHERPSWGPCHHPRR